MSQEPNNFAIAADKAEAELIEQMKADPEFSKQVMRLAQWWKNWYYSAGHRKLGRMLVRMAKGQIVIEQPAEAPAEELTE